MDSKTNRYILIGIVAFLIGWAIGLFVFGWLIWPVQYTKAFPKDLADSYQQFYITAMADLYSFDNNVVRAQEAFKDWPDADQTICQMAVTSADAGAQARYNALATVLNGSGCSGVISTVPGEEAGSGRSGFAYFALICGLLLVLAVVVIGIFLVWQRRSSQSAQIEPVPDQFSAEPTQIEQAGTEPQITPIARFQTTFARGHDTYDESFSIENASGDFLGECGVGLSETVGTDVPKNVTAFEVWLFDKNDIRTVTKVVMSDHAFFDEAIKAKLAPKGEPVLARPNETIVLETATLIVNAEIIELEYGTGTLPPQSYFERFTVELSAWAKEGSFDEPDIQGRVDEMLDF